jgi:hypothetical protein
MFSFPTSMNTLFIDWCQSSFGTSSFYFISLWKQINDLKAAVEASPPSGEVLPADRLKLIHQGKRHTQANMGKAVARDFRDVADGHHEGVQALIPALRAPACESSSVPPTSSPRVLLSSFPTP